MTRRPVHAVIYSHVWAVQALAQAGIGELQDAAVVELAVNSNLQPVFEAVPRPRPGLAGLLMPGTALDQVLQSVHGLPWPIALAPRPAVPVAALGSAVALLESTASRHDRIVLMVHVAELPQLLPALAGVSDFRVLWDLADAPSFALASAGEALAASGALAPDRWRGFHLYQHADRPVAHAAARRAELLAVLQAPAAAG